MRTEITINNIKIIITNQNGFRWSLEGGGISQNEQERGHTTLAEAQEEATFFVENYVIKNGSTIELTNKKFVFKEYKLDGKHQWIADEENHFCFVFTTGIVGAFRKRQITRVSKKKCPNLPSAKKLYTTLYEKIQNDFLTSLDIM